MERIIRFRFLTMVSMVFWLTAPNGRDGRGKRRYRKGGAALQGQLTMSEANSRATARNCEYVYPPTLVSGGILD